jgi:hypothetical protein
LTFIDLKSNSKINVLHLYENKLVSIRLWATSELSLEEEWKYRTDFGNQLSANCEVTFLHTDNKIEKYSGNKQKSDNETLL